MNEPRYTLKLYITGSTPRSLLAISNIRKICQDHLLHRYDLEIIDLYINPEIAAQQQIVAAPTLLKISPEPVSRVVGDLSNQRKVLELLNLA